MRAPQNNTIYKDDPAWLNWCALCDFTLAATADEFDRHPGRRDCA